MSRKRRPRPRPRGSKLLENINLVKKSQQHHVRLTLEERVRVLQDRLVTLDLAFECFCQQLEANGTLDRKELERAMLKASEAEAEPQ